MHKAKHRIVASKQLPTKMKVATLSAKHNIISELAWAKILIHKHVAHANPKAPGNHEYVIEMV